MSNVLLIGVLPFDYSKLIEELAGVGWNLVGNAMDVSEITPGDVAQNRIRAVIFGETYASGGLLKNIRDDCSLQRVSYDMEHLKALGLKVIAAGLSCESNRIFANFGANSISLPDARDHRIIHTVVWLEALKQKMLQVAAELE
jgi:hypothetical protein